MLNIYLDRDLNTMIDIHQVLFLIYFDGNGFNLKYVQLLEKISPPTEKLIKDGFNMSRWFKPQDYATDF